MLTLALDELLFLKLLNHLIYKLGESDDILGLIKVVFRLQSGIHIACFNKVSEFLSIFHGSVRVVDRLRKLCIGLAWLHGVGIPSFHSCCLLLGRLLYKRFNCAQGGCSLLFLLKAVKGIPRVIVIAWGLIGSRGVSDSWSKAALSQHKGRLKVRWWGAGLFLDRLQ